MEVVAPCRPYTTAKSDILQPQQRSFGAYGCLFQWRRFRGFVRCRVSRVSSDTILCVQARSLLGMIVEVAKHDRDIELGGLRGFSSMSSSALPLLFPSPLLQLILDS
jgi:hypothetical protein